MGIGVGVPRRLPHTERPLRKRRGGAPLGCAVDVAWRPPDASTRRSVRGAFVGSGWFRFTDDIAKRETLMAGGGCVSQRIRRGRGEEGEHASFLGAPVVASDVWCMGDDLILVKSRWGLLRTTYVLAELKGEPQTGRRTLP